MPERRKYSAKAEASKRAIDVDGQIRCTPNELPARDAKTLAVGGALALLGIALKLERQLDILSVETRRRHQARGRRVVAARLRGRRRVGATVGDFQLGEQIGQGGMGVVYDARQLSLDREVAVKLIRPDHLYTGPDHLPYQPLDQR